MAANMEALAAFLVEADKLKGVTRAGYLCTGERHENSAEHSWHLALGLVTLARELDLPLDLPKALTMALIHDLCEIDAGDTPVYSQRADQHQAEARGVARLAGFGLKFGPELQALWQEYEAQESREARWVKVLDRLLPFLSNLATQGRSWQDWSVRRSQVLARNQVIAQQAPEIYAWMVQRLDECVAQGWLLPDEENTVTRDFFAHKAAAFDQGGHRTDNVANIARAIQAAVPLAPAMHLLDFGSGTGLLLEALAPQVGRFTAIDQSAAMNAQLEQKRAALPCALTLVVADLEGDWPTTLAPEAKAETGFDGVVSSMTLHHIRDVPALLAKLHGVTRPGGFLAVADLDAEDGSFHQEDTGVFHTGFDRDWLAQAARDAGFLQVAVTDASVVHKPQGDYPVFLLTARR